MANETTAETCGSGNPEAHRWGGEVLPYEQRSDSSLSRLLDQFGRNGPMSEIQKIHHDQIAAILADRQASGVSFGENGVMSCRV